MHRLLFTTLLLAFVFVAPAQENAYAIDVTPVGKGVYVYRSYFDYGGAKTPANGLVVVSKKSAAVIDTPWDGAQTRQLLDWIRRETGKTVAFAVVTHAHQDRIGGVSVLEEAGIPVYGTAMTAAEAEADGLAGPTEFMPPDTVLRLDGLPIETFYPGPGHSRDNLVVYLPKQRLLFGGCFLKSAKAPGLGNLEDADTAAWPNSVARVKDRFKKAQIVIPGHGGWEDGAIENTLKLLSRP